MSAIEEAPSQIVKLLVVLAVGACIGYVVGNRQELAQSSLMTVQQETLERQSKAIAQLKTDLGVKETLAGDPEGRLRATSADAHDQEAQVQEQKRQLAFFEASCVPPANRWGYPSTI